MLNESQLIEFERRGLLRLDAGSADVRRRLAGDHRWFQELFGDTRNRSRFLDASVIEGVEVRVTEVTGKAGDAYLMHPWLMHAAAPNTSGAPRSMITDTVFAR